MLGGLPPLPSLNCMKPRPRRTRTRLEAEPTVRNGGERTSRGTFARGNTAARGRQSASSRLRGELEAAVDGPTWTAIVERAVAQARRGDRHARSFLASYLLGKPRTQAASVEAFALGKLDTISCVADASARLARAAAAGRIDLWAAREIAGLLEAVRSALETVDVERRLEAIEERLRS